MVIGWTNAWKLYISFLNDFCAGLNLLSKSMSQSRYDKKHYDPYGTDQRIIELDKKEREREDRNAQRWAQRVFNKYRDEFLSLALANSRNLRSVPIGLDKCQAIEWIDECKCEVVSTSFKPAEYSFKKAICKIVEDYYDLIDFKGEVLIIMYIEKDCDLQQIMNAQCIKVSGNDKSLKICVIRWTEGEGDGIYKIDICYR